MLFNGFAELERVLKLDMESSQVMLGINNRDLQTFKVDIENNRRIMESSAGQQVRHLPDTTRMLIAAREGFFSFQVLRPLLSYAFC